MDIITGLYRCNCHPFESWDEQKKASKQKFNIGDKVKSAHSGIEYDIIEPLYKGYYIIKCGDRPCDITIDHKECLIKIATSPI
jgi:hypothetical protein